ncbi:MAG: Protein translocase subunit SecD [Chlamydiae bacterium]|nr:Protein translocase subunit SecD [Chlamydiota bacterium]
MEKVKRWQIALIVLVVVLTIYNILPTLIYYSKPLSKPVDEKQAMQVAKNIVDRVEDLEKESIDWLRSFSKNLGVKPKSIDPVANNPQLIAITFSNPEDNLAFRHYLPRAGALIPFVPAQLTISQENAEDPTKTIVERKISFTPSESEIPELFKFTTKKEGGKPSPHYYDLAIDRFEQVALGFGGVTSNAAFVQTLKVSGNKYRENQTLLEIAQNIVSFETIFGDSSPVTKRFFKSFSQLTPKVENAADTLISALDDLEKSYTSKTSDSRVLLEKDRETLKSAIAVIKRNKPSFNSGTKPLDLEILKQDVTTDTSTQLVALNERNPYFEAISLDWEKGSMTLSLHSDVEKLLHPTSGTKKDLLKKERLNQLIINEVAKVAQKTDESISPGAQGYQIALDKLTQSDSFLVLNLSYIAKQESQGTLEKLSHSWNRSSPDLQPDAFPVWDYAQYQSLPSQGRKFGLLVYAPVLEQSEPIKGFRSNSIYVIAKGLNPIFQKYQQSPDSDQAQTFFDEFEQLQKVLRQQGYQLTYLAEGSDYPKEFQQDLVFEKPDYYSDLLAATRENFTVLGNKRFATLEFTDLEQRIAVENKIDTQIHDELIKWKEDHQAALVDIQDPQAKFLVPPPTSNVYWDNLKLSTKEYFRGDSRKILKWGLDLKGGKSILIGLRDQNNRPVTNKIDLTEGVNELTQRVNKMGLSEVDVRVEGNHIALDFPSSNGLSAQELIKGSTMYFHVVNEDFSSPQSPLFASTQKFLQDVWNEAVITNRKDIEGINFIAWKHLGGSEDGQTIHPRSEHAKRLYEAGLKLASPTETLSTSTLDDHVSQIAPYTGSDYADWKGQTNPLLIVFNNFALEGSQIDNIHTSYDTRDGNTLAFSVLGAHTSKMGEKINPREALYSWTSQFAKDRIMGTEREKVAPNRGWRLAIVLNGRVISDPQLNQALRDNIQVNGGFTQNEVTKLAGDLKAGSLSFKPQILSEDNVSADLGQKEKSQGILATGIALLLVIVVMIVYYRFSGLIASIAVLFNLLIIWATLQNLQATLSLSGIAGIILTLGMAVDANVLVFERIREEMKHTKNVSTAIYTGYKQAFSAIFDSNVTTIIAALILLNFDTGPIKGLAITLTIGITSSMFTALFMTRVFFTKWAEKAHNKTLSMANWFQVKSINFLKNAKWVTSLFALTIIIGSSLLFLQHKSILGMDFTGGYSLTVQLDESPLGQYRTRVREALLLAGAKSTDFQIRELNQPNMLRIQLSSALEEKGRPFYQLSQSTTSPVFGQNNPRISWVILALEKQGIQVQPQSLASLDKNWSEMSGQLSKTTRNNALIGLSLALFFILVYISFRFEIKFAISAIICTLHDVLITLAILAILHLFNVPIQINMQVIAALMTIIGYSLNDTIIVFDRIREEKKLTKKASFYSVINRSLSLTLNRTLMTSITTFVVLLALLVLGGSKIFDFSLMMSIGVVVGTLSSLFVAPLLLQYFHGSETEETVSVKPLQNGSAA